MFFIVKPGCSGKTFLYNAIVALARPEKHIAKAVASFGIKNHNP
jgi:hypothetical protein